jgi:hypothetical protein
MTSPASYVFHEERNPQGERKEQANLTRVFVADNKITIYTKRLVKNPKTDTLHERTIGKDILSLHENANGTKYLKHFRKNLGSTLTDFSLKSITGKLFEYPITLISSEGLEFIDQTVLGWFGYDSQRSLEDVKGLLLFPALRGAGLSGSKLPALLSELQKDYGTITKALRENDSWLDFIMDICKPTMKTMNDAAIVDAYVEELLPIAMMDLGAPLSELYEDNSYTLIQIRKSFMSLDLKFLNFMFKYIPSSSRGEALNTLLALVRVHQVRKQLRNPMGKAIFSYVNSDVNLNKIPLKLRSKLAVEFLKSLKETCSEVSKSMATSNTQVATELCNVFRYWFAQLILEPSLKTELTVETLENRFQELLGSPLQNDPSPIQFVKKPNLTFCILNQSNIGGKKELYHSDVFTSLKALVNKLPSNKGIDAGYHLLNGYVAVDGDFMLSSGEFYSLDDILQMIEDGILIVDEQLRKLGRKVTPENRLAFLSLGIKERKFKGTWKYYDLGVTDPYKILMLKKNKVFGKKDIQTYSALPDEMFYEFLALGSTEPDEVVLLIHNPVSY